MDHYTHLSISDRRRIQVFLEMGLSVKQIADRLQRHRSSIYREIKRNAVDKCYLNGPAQQKAKARANRQHQSKLSTNPVLQDYVVTRLKLGWSPEQISGRMKRNQMKFYVCHETIYRFIYSEKDKILYQYLPYKHLKRRRHYDRKQNKCRFGEIRLISNRPQYIEKRDRIGHWEADLIEFKGSKKKSIITLVERKSRIVALVKNHTKASAVVMEKIRNQFFDNLTLPCVTITFDQGMEFSNYRYIEQAVGCKVYYCQTRSPWQKGTNENTNGRLRRYLPSNTNISEITQSQLDLLADKMNNLPRKCLGYLTPKELISKHNFKLCRTSR